jgi:Leucine-rich repeat (LRR) protein
MFVNKQLAALPFQPSQEPEESKLHWTLCTLQFDKVTQIDGSSRRLNSIDLSALRELSSVKKVDFRDNKLPLEPFAVMAALEELDLSCNFLKSFDYKSSESMTGDDRAWSCLVKLNLAFNACAKFLTDLQLIPRLSKLNLSNNSLNSLPSNLMHFTSLSYLDLTGNNLNGDPSFFSLATIPALQTLVLNENDIVHIPKFQFGFEALRQLHLNGNRIEVSDDIVSLTDFEQIEADFKC